MDATNIPRLSLSLGRKRVSWAIGSGFLLFNKNLNIFLLISGSMFLGSGKTLHPASKKVSSRRLNNCLARQPSHLTGPSKRYLKDYFFENLYLFYDNL